MKRKISKKMIFLILASALVLALGISVVAGNISDGQKTNSLSEELSLGIHYLDELDYEAALAHFQQALIIDAKNVASYIGCAISFDALDNTDMAIQILEEGLAATQSSLLEAMLSDLRAGRSISSEYRMEQPESTIQFAKDPFKTLKLLNSDYYKWDFVACAELFNFDYEQYAGTSVNLGTYYGLDIVFDAVTENVCFNLSNKDYDYGYQLLSNSQLQVFHLEDKGTGADVPPLKEIACDMVFGSSYEEFETSYGMGQLELADKVFYLVDSNLGEIGCANWSKGNEKQVCLYLMGADDLRLQLSYENEELVKLIYGCGIPDNLRSKAINWIGDMLDETP